MNAPALSKTPIAPARLDRDAWLDAAFEAVVQGGFERVRVLNLAQQLGVTRGSFYWHFADHAALITALTGRWQQGEIALDAQWQARSAGDARADLESLLDAALAHAGADLRNIRFELALRDLGRQNEVVASLLAEVDAARMALFEHKFRRLCGEPGRAADLAAMFYLTIVGSFQALSRPGNPPQTREFLRGLILRYLVEPYQARVVDQGAASGLSAGAL